MGSISNGKVDAERLALEDERRIRYIHFMAPTAKTVVLVQKCPRNEDILGAVECERFTVVDLNRVKTTAWSNCPIYLHGGACSIIRNRVFMRCVYVLYPKTVS